MNKNKGLVQIASAADGAEIADAIRERAGEAIAFSPGLCPDGLPEPHQNAVLVFVLTEQALSDPAVRRFATLAAASRFACLPVPPVRTGFDFRRLDGEFSHLGRLNAVAWNDGDVPGEALMSAIRRHLGLEPFSRDCRLFVSYKRSDGMEAAHAIYRHFRGEGFDAFLDSEDEAIEPGEEFQSRIHEAIPEKDFLLLVESPDAADSDWVRKEVSVALANRVSILVVRLDGSDGFPQVRDLPAFHWGEDPDRSLFELDRAVRSQLAARRTFDRRVHQTLEHLKPLLPLSATVTGKRRLMLRIGEGADTRTCLLDYEDAAYDLMHLHRLALGRTSANLTSPEDAAVLVHRGRGLSPEERTAIDWARHEEPLHVLSLDEVVAFFLSRAPLADNRNR